MVEQDDVVMIGRADKCDGEDWIWISSPTTGWMKAEYVQCDQEILFGDSSDSVYYGELSPGAIATAEIPVHSAPNSDSVIVATVGEGSALQISRSESISGTEWAYIEAPTTGWITMEYVQLAESSGEYLNTQAAAKDTLPVYPAPVSDSTTTEALDAGTVVTIGRQETINGMNWTYILEPTQGWVPTDLLQSAESPAESTASSGISLDAKQIREIDIEWAAGSITIEPAEVDAIQVMESDPSEPKYAMVWKQNNDKLTIRFSETIGLDFNFGITINDVVSKDLTILVPMGWECDSLEVDAASAALLVKNLVIDEVDFDGASGTCDFENCAIDELDLDTASGDIHFTGSLDVLNCDAASASVIAVFDNVPSRIDMDSMSGDLDITLPSTAGFSVTMDGLSTDFVSDFGYSQNKEGSYYRGNGACKISMDAMSGDIYIREYKAADAIPAATATADTHHHTDTCTTDPDSCPDNSTHYTEPHHN